MKRLWCFAEPAVREANWPLSFVVVVLAIPIFFDQPSAILPVVAVMPHVANEVERLAVETVDCGTSFFTSSSMSSQSKALYRRG